MRANIDGKPYSVALSWHPVASRADIEERAAETGRERGVVLRSGKRIVGVGLADDDGKSPPPSAAALLALHCPGESLIAIERAERGGHWLGAVVDGVVVPGADAVLDGPDAVDRQIREILRDIQCRVTGSASGEFGGDGSPALAPASLGKARAGAAIKPLRAGASPTQLLVLLASIGAIAWLAAQTLDKKSAPTPAIPMPFDDQAAELKRQAIAARNRSLSSDLSGFEPGEFGKAASAAAKSLERSAAWWKLERKRCGESGCALTWSALTQGATPERLAAALALPRAGVQHDLRADAVSATAPLGAVGRRIDADAQTALTPIDDALVDRCRRYNGAGGVCALAQAQPASFPNAQSLPPELAYRRGKLSLGGSLARMDSLLAAFDAMPQVRADALEIDFAKQEFFFEGRYVAP
jgi:hypothetical protein